MKPNDRRKNKRNRALAGPSKNFSKILREINHKIRSKEYESALISLNDLAVNEKNPRKLGKILLLTADSSRRLSRYSEAIDIYKKSGDFLRSAADPAWFSAALGEICCLLKSVQSQLAYSRALDVMKITGEDMAALKKIEDAPVKNLLSAGGIFVGPRPERPSKILTRLGKLFLQEGYPDVATDFFQNAIMLSPNGASRARQSMAEISLAKNDLENAERFSRESLQMGRFQAKTIYSWALYHQARSRRGKRPHDPELYSSMLQMNNRMVSDRAIVIIVESLRKLSDPAWKDISIACINDRSDYDSIYKIELSKLILADTKITESNPAVIVSASSSLLNHRLISTIEAVALLKVYTLYSLKSNSNEKPLLKFIANTTKKLSAEAKARAIHSASLGAMLAARYDVARILLQEQIATLEPGSTQWGKDLWALARMETVVGNYSNAASHYLRCADHEKTPIRFQLQGMLRWLAQIQRGGVEPDFEATKEKLKRILSRSNDYSILLDAARQLTLAGSRFKDIKNLIANAAIEAARASFESASDPSLALGIIIHLSRRQYYDLAMKDSIYRYWDSLPLQKREWLWSQDSRFWEYCTLVILSYESVKMIRATDDLTKALLKHPTTPSHGYVQIATTYGDILIERGEIRLSLDYYERSILIAPANRYTAKAYYWRALMAKNRGDLSELNKNASLIRRCFGNYSRLSWEKSLDARASILLRESQKEPKKNDDRRYSVDYLSSEEEKIALDMELLRNA